MDSVVPQIDGQTKGDCSQAEQQDPNGSRPSRGLDEESDEGSAYVLPMVTKKSSTASAVSAHRSYGSESSLYSGIDKYMPSKTIGNPHSSASIVPAVSRRVSAGLAGLRFVPDVEEDFVQALNARNHSCLTKVWPVFFLCSIGDFFVMQSYNRLGHSDIAARIAGWSRMGTCSMLLFWPVLAYVELMHVDTAFIMAAVICSGLMQMGSLQRMSIMYETDFCDKELAKLTDSYIGICNDEVELWIPYALLTCMVHMLIEVRAAYSWIVPFVQIVLYLVFSVAVDAAPLLMSIKQTVSLGLVGCLCWVSRYATEVRDRRAFKTEALMREDSKLQAEQLEDIQQRLEDLKAIQESFNVPEKNSVVPVPRILSGITEEGFNVFPRQVPKLGFPEDLDMSAGDVPNPHLSRAMTGKRADSALIMKMARHIKDRSYTLKQFFEDSVKSFPELVLFQDGWQSMERTRRSSSGMSSGLTAQTEYQRTFGALFAVYWLLRLDIDGKVGFSFGVDDEWRYPDYTDKEVCKRMEDHAKRLDFLHNMRWEEFQKVVHLAKCDNEERIAALLCLTAIHDIMKVDALCPVVQPEHESFCGYPSGAIITDHDIAISYVLEKYPHLLPSYDWLPPESQRVVSFTQSKLGFNHGWFVQSEAPPGVMLATFKREARDSGEGDIGFYFLHWITDLAGAEGTPLGGAEKYSCKFPQAVLHAFLWSIPYLQRLSNTSETSVVEDYLEARWLQTHRRSVPTDFEAVAQMRLSVMAQTSAEQALQCFDELKPRTQKLLATEMALTGIAGQCFSRSPASGGPAFLVYYGPALLQRCHKDSQNLRMALLTLAQVFAAGRQIWPLSSDKEGETVTLQIGQMKGHDIGHVFYSLPGEKRSVWVLVQSSETEAFCDIYGAIELNQLRKSDVKYHVLDLGADSEESLFEDEDDNVSYTSRQMSEESQFPETEEEITEQANCHVPLEVNAQMLNEVDANASTTASSEQVQELTKAAQWFGF